MSTHAYIQAAGNSNVSQQQFWNHFQPREDAFAGSLVDRE
jgi:hypothetical protein